MRRMLVATIAAATLALGLALPASAQLSRSDAARAADAGAATQAAAARSACKIIVGGKVGYRQCSIAPTEESFDGRRHVFVVGSNRQVYYVWQLRRGGSAYSDWTTLGGQGYGRISTEAYGGSVPWMQIKVLGYNGQSFRNYCKTYWSGGGYPGWTRWFGC